MAETGVKNDKNSGFSDRLGFILASAGSAVGLGNIWRFPYLAAKYGGGAFLLTYIILALTIGFSLSLAEIALGRKTGKSSATAFGSLDRRFSFVGYLCLAIPVLVIPYYSVIGGWVIKYAITYLFGGGQVLAEDGYFESFTSSVGEPMLLFLIFLFLTVSVVGLGVKGGIERISKLLMPPLLAFTLFIAVYTLFSVDGAVEGLKYYLLPNFDNFSIMTIVVALGQLFYSMSIAMGVLITFGSYTSKDISIEKSVRYVEIFDTGVAFLSGLMIIPAVFAFLGPSGTAEGAPLMFITLPRIFVGMSGGGIIGAIFFTIVILAALTSNIALAEAFVAMLSDKFKMSRNKALIIAAALFLAFGIPSSLGYGPLAGIRLFGMGILDMFDFFSSNIIMPIIALFTAVLVGYIITPRPLVEEIELNGEFKHKRLFTATVRYLAPPFILIVLVSTFLDLFGVISI